MLTYDESFAHNSFFDHLHAIREAQRTKIIKELVTANFPGLSGKFRGSLLKAAANRSFNLQPANKTPSCAGKTERDNDAHLARAISLSLSHQISIHSFDGGCVPRTLKNKKDENKGNGW